MYDKFCFSPTPSPPQLVTRAVRVIDLITNLDMTAFHSLGGWNKMLARLDLEVSECMKESPVVLPSEVKPAPSREVPMEEGSVEEGGREVGDEVERVVPMETSGAEAQVHIYIFNARMTYQFRMIHVHVCD